MRDFWIGLMVIGLAAMIASYIFMPMSAPGSDSINLSLIVNRLMAMIASAALFVGGCAGAAAATAAAAGRQEIASSNCRDARRITHPIAFRRVSLTLVCQPFPIALKWGKHVLIQAD